jgi:hypothetical protein
MPAESAFDSPARHVKAAKGVLPGGRWSAYVSPAQPNGVAAPQRGGVRQRRFVIATAIPAWLVSAAVHAVALMALALIVVGSHGPRTAMVLRLSEALMDQPPTQFEPPSPIEPVLSTRLSVAPDLSEIAAEVPRSLDVISPVTEMDAASVSIGVPDFGERTAPRGDLMTSVGALAGHALDGRGADHRAAMIKRFGGTPASEKAVAMALRWFAQHQSPDGSWHFNHEQGSCQGQCPNPGDMNDPIAATAMAILPFLGAGQTHREGEYQQQVQSGLDFLVRSIDSTGSLAYGPGNMYSHGLASIALCEAYAMSGDHKLMQPAQAVIQFIVLAQDPRGGGWRYAPRQPGDTSVVGWQVMALKSAHMAYLDVPAATVKGATRFLDSVQVDRGAYYRYMNPRPPRDTVTSVGLLCRMYLGWKRELPAMRRGVELLSKTGPSKEDMYFNYYATQVLRHWGGEEWVKWNQVMRDQLVDSQNRTGHAQGSWIIEGSDRGISKGGRVYCTSLATMILEVYYRHMPLYSEAAADDDFPLN